MKEKKRILVVDDEREFGQMLKVNLEITGQYEVVTETRGTRAIEIAKTFRPDLILLDVIMPDLTGPEVAKQLEKDELLKDIPILFLTAMPKEKVDLKGCGAADYPFILKPVTSDDLIRHIETYLAKK